MNQEIMREIQRIEANTRHDTAIALILFSLVGLHLFSIEDQKQREKTTAVWVSWGVIFFILGFFILAPERDLQQNNEGDLKFV